MNPPTKAIDANLRVLELQRENERLRTALETIKLAAFGASEAAIKAGVDSAICRLLNDLEIKAQAALNPREHNELIVEVERADVARLRKALEEYAKRQNWRRSAETDLNNVWRGDNGPEIAQAALNPRGEGEQ